MSTVRSRALTALVVGAATTAYYAVPDLTRSRAVRGLVKTACTAVVVGVSLPATPAGVAELREQWQELKAGGPGGPDRSAALDNPVPDGTDPDGTDPDTDDPTREVATDAPGDRAGAPVAVAVAAGAAALAVSGVLTVVTERWIHRRAEARGAAGARLPHTRTGLVMGALSAALALLPEPDDRRPASGTSDAS